MKINKEMQKQLMQQIKLNAENKGYKIKSNSLYQLKGDNFIHSDYLIVESKKIIFRIYIKKYSYDNIFWDTMNMKDNKKKNDSLRAIGAFKAPSILIKKNEYELSENVVNLANQFIEAVEVASDNFLANNEINMYVLKYEYGQDNKILKCLAYLDMKQYAQANEVARAALGVGDSGRFESEGNSFFEWVLLEKYLKQ